VRGKSFLIPLLLAGSALVHPATLMAGGGGFTPVEPSSPSAEAIADIYYLLAGVAGFVFLLVTVPLVLFIFRFRSRGRSRDVEGPQIRGHNRLELAWTVLPVLILVVIATFVFYKLPGLTGVENARGGADLEVRVEGHRFYWQYEYPNGVIAIDTLRLPVNRVVRFEVTAPDSDVNHSFWVPAIGGKLDAIPGETTHTSVRPDRTGVFEGVCAELCGIQHAVMLARIEVVPRASFDRWLSAEARKQETGDSRLGENTFTGACAKCHGMQAEGLIGPPLAGNALLNDKQGLEEVVRNGRGAMPAVGEDWGPRQFDALFGYMRKRYGGAGGS